jgi:hypothetical protein
VELKSFIKYFANFYNRKILSVKFAPVLLDRVPDVFHQPELEGHVVNGQQRAAGRLLVRHQRVQVRAGHLQTTMSQHFVINDASALRPINWLQI